MNKTLKVIFKEEKKKDGTTFIKMLTILKKKDGKDQWAQIKFGDAVNTKVWKNKNQLILVEDKKMKDGTPNIRIPKSFEPYMYQGKKKYPYVYIQEILKSKPYEYHGDGESHYQDAKDVDFNMDDVDDSMPWE